MFLHTNHMVWFAFLDVLFISPSQVRFPDIYMPMYLAEVTNIFLLEVLATVRARTACHFLSIIRLSLYMIQIKEYSTYTQHH
jgi:hypothetical protein